MLLVKKAAFSYFFYIFLFKLVRERVREEKGREGMGELNFFNIDTSMKTPLMFLVSPSSVAIRTGITEQEAVAE